MSYIFFLIKIMHQSVPAALMPSFHGLTPGYTRFCLSFLLLPPLTPFFFGGGGGWAGTLELPNSPASGTKKEGDCPALNQN